MRSSFHQRQWVRTLFPSFHVFDDKSVLTPWLRFAIDAAFLDRDLRILKIARNLRPWQLAFAPRGTRCVLETAAGVLGGLKAGDRLAEKRKSPEA